MLLLRPASAAIARRSSAALRCSSSYSSDAAEAAAAEAIAAADAWPARLSLANRADANDENAAEPYDAIVVGLGAHGSSALYHLARRFAAEDDTSEGGPAEADPGRRKRRRRRVLGIEAHPLPGHDRASHGGDTRITRQAYQESPLYVPLLRRSAELTSELESLVKTQLFWRTGVLHAGGRLFKGALQSARLHGIEHEALAWGREAQKRWPGVRLPVGTPALWEPGAGVLAPEKMIRAHVAAAAATGAADVLCGDGIARWWEGDGDGDGPAAAGLVRVETASGRTFAARGALVLAAGAWMPRLVPELKGWAVPRRYTVAWLEPPPSSSSSEEEGQQGGGRQHYALGAFPPFLMEEPGTGVPFYGFPAWPHPGVGGPLAADPGLCRRRQRAVKLGAFSPSSPDLTGAAQGSGSASTDPGETLDRAMSARDEQEVRRFADACLPGLRGGAVAGFSACIFTDTPDSHFLLDVHPRYAGGESPRVVLCSACSGHGFKLSPAVGEALADMAEGRRCGDDDDDDEALALHRMRPERPGMREVLRRFGLEGVSG